MRGPTQRYTSIEVQRLPHDEGKKLSSPLMTVAEVAAYLGVPVATCYAWNSRSTGPKYFKVGKYVRYRQSDVDAWLDQQANASVGRE